MGLNKWAGPICLYKLTVFCIPIYIQTVIILSAYTKASVPPVSSEIVPVTSDPQTPAKIDPLGALNAFTRQPTQYSQHGHLYQDQINKPRLKVLDLSIKDNDSMLSLRERYRQGQNLPPKLPSNVLLLIQGGSDIRHGANLYKPIRINESYMIWLRYTTETSREYDWKEVKNFVTFGSEDEDIEVKEMGVRLVCDEDLDQVDLSMFQDLPTLSPHGGNGMISLCGHGVWIPWSW
ncbi:hypothetical protein Tco_1570714 [Tanacetum coccineum]